jgi:hypothetical protein
VLPRPACYCSASITRIPIARGHSFEQKQKILEIIKKICDRAGRSCYVAERWSGSVHASNQAIVSQSGANGLEQVETGVLVTLVDPPTVVA